ncbi:citrate transporter [Fusobacterium perfoetens]|uniref:citrate transporter n=1 Tax=Fusobacterium perfoetens TaxID=852 RepID=UPI0004899120|nr:citrate transporter [Fusobacterium perfoetens]MCI6153290.1 citrate transporter [Fusobacterium perfoetens]MDY3238391.1 citrate transporter [Fusobacterium perfoetens]
MIFDLPPILGFLPLLLYIYLMLKGKDMNLSVLICVLLGAVMTGETITGFGEVLKGSLSSFLSLIGFIIVLGSGLGEVLTHTKVAQNIVYFVVEKTNIKTEKQAILISMITCTLLVSMLGTLSGSVAIVAPILIPIVSCLGLTPSTLGVIFHGAAATGLQIGPFVPPVATIMGLTGLTYSSFLLNAGLPMGIIIWGSTYFIACRTQKLTRGTEKFDDSYTKADDFKATKTINRATFTFIGTMAVMLIYGIIAKAGASYAIVVMITASLLTGLSAGMSLTDSIKKMVDGASKMYWMFFMFILFDPFLNYVAKSGAFEAISNYMKPLIDVGGVAAFLVIAAAIGVFGISGAGVAQAQITHELFLPLVTAMSVKMEIWSFIVLVACQVTFFVSPTVDMVGTMGLAHSKNIKAMLKNGWCLTIITFIVVIIRAIIYARSV